MKLSKQAKNIQQSEIRAMSILCKEQNGINMAQGLCDLEVPIEVKQGAIEAIQNGKNIYTAASGTQSLRQAIASKHNSMNNFSIQKENVLVSSGATGAFYSIAQTLFNSGDEVILFEPYYGYHVATLKALGCRIKTVKQKAPSYDIDFKKLKKKITHKTKAILICNPSNPSGKVYTQSELKQLGQIAKHNKLTVISDEMYEHFVYDGLEFTSAWKIDSLKKRCVVISGFSKVYSITGWRLGYAISTKKVIKAASAMNDLVYVCPPSPLQYGVTQGLLKLPASYYKEVAKQHQQKRDTFIQALNEVGLKAEYTKGAYYVLADISKLQGADDKQKVLTLLSKTGVAAVPARAFYTQTKGNYQARFCFSKKQSELDEAIRRLKANLKN